MTKKKSLQVNMIEHATITVIRPSQPYIFKRGDGRRLPSDPAKLAAIPLEAQVTDKAEYEAVASWGRNHQNTTLTPTDTVYDRNPNPHWPRTQTLNAQNIPIVVYLGNADGTGRPKQSKILITADKTEAYGFVTWTEFFGHCIKECAPTRTLNGQTVSYLTKLTDVQRDRVLEAVKDTGTAI